MLKKIIFFLIVSGFIWSFFGADIIKNYKAYGYFFEYQCDEKQGEKINQLKAITLNKAEAMDSIYVYTNDSSPFINIIISPNLNKSFINISDYSYAECKEAIKWIDYYIENKDSLGFNISCKNTATNKIFELKNLKDKTERLLKYKVIQHWDYTDRQKKRFAQKNVDYKHNGEINEFIHTARITITDYELFNQIKNPKNALEVLSVPDFESFKTNKFYFFCYNSQLKKEIFKEKIELFKSLYLEETSEKLELYLRSFKVKLD